MDLLDDSLRQPHSFTRLAHTLAGARAWTHALGHAQARLCGRGREGKGARAGWRCRGGGGGGGGEGFLVEGASGPFILHWRASGTRAPGHSVTRSRQSEGDGIEKQQQRRRRQRRQQQQLEDTDRRRQREREKTSDPGHCKSIFSLRRWIKTRPDLLQHRDHVRKQITHSNVSRSRKRSPPGVAVNGCSVQRMLPLCCIHWLLF